jgi:Lrp/AsnC family transcriptional regulator for asnA, asnC and gidA
MNLKNELDAVDIKIIELLRDDARKSFRNISNILGVTEATIRRRVNRMIEEKYIKKFTVIMDEENFGSKTKVIIKIKPDLRKINFIIDELTKINEVTDIWRLSGEAGLMVKIEIPNIIDFDPLIEQKLSKIEGIEIIETSFITKEIKNKY